MHLWWSSRRRRRTQGFGLQYISRAPDAPTRPIVPWMRNKRHGSRVGSPLPSPQPKGPWQNRLAGNGRSRWCRIWLPRTGIAKLGLHALPVGTLDPSSGDGKDGKKICLVNLPRANKDVGGRSRLASRVKWKARTGLAMRFHSRRRAGRS